MCVPPDSTAPAAYFGSATNGSVSNLLENAPDKSSEASLKNYVTQVYAPISCSTKWETKTSFLAQDIWTPSPESAWNVSNHETLTFVQVPKTAKGCGKAIKYDSEISKVTSASCPGGFKTPIRFDPAQRPYCVSELQEYSASLSPAKNRGCSNAVGNPCNAATGNKFQAEVDYVAPGSGGLELTRYYNSSTGTWSHSYSRQIVYTKYDVAAFGAVVSVYRPDGKIFEFRSAPNGEFIGEADVDERLIAAYSAGGKITGWKYVTFDDATENYAADGRLLSIVDRVGRKTTISYQADLRMAAVQDPFGRKIQFGYTPNGEVAHFTTPAGGTYRYSYDGAGDLVSVTYPDEAIRRYLYGETNLNPGGQAHALTGIIDENGKRFATYQYDLQGRIVTTEHANGAGRVLVNYSADERGNPQFSNVTDALGTTRQYYFTVSSGVARNRGISAPCPICGDDSETKQYDIRGNVVGQVDRNGAFTEFSYEPLRNLEVKRIEARNSVLQKTVYISWHETFHLPVSLTEPNRISTYTYDSVHGTLTTRTVTDANTRSSRSWSYSYDKNGLLTRIDGPRTDVDDVSTFAYDSKGNLSRATDALGHSIQYTAYDADGRLLP